MSSTGENNQFQQDSVESCLPFQPWSPMIADGDNEDRPTPDSQWYIYTGMSLLPTQIHSAFEDAMWAHDHVEPYFNKGRLDDSQLDMSSGHDQGLEQPTAPSTESDTLSDRSSVTEEGPSFVEEPLAGLNMAAMVLGGHAAMATDSPSRPPEDCEVFNNTPAAAPTTAPTPSAKVVPAAIAAIEAESRPVAGFYCSTCRKTKPVTEFARAGYEPSERHRYGTCEVCRSSKRSYYVRQGGVDGAEPKPKRVRTGEQSGGQPHGDGTRKCTGCHKHLERKEFLDSKYGDRLLQTCEACRIRKRETDKKKREARNATSQ